MMSRWIVIDADAIPNIYTATHQELIFALEDALGASIDIVHCGECKYAHMTYGGECKYCDNITDDDGNLIEVYYDGSHFCSDGERSE